jgi:hypothetical protein
VGIRSVKAVLLSIDKSASLERGATVSAVAREAGIHPGQLYGWRRQLLRRSPPAATFAAVRIAAEPAAAALPTAGLIEVEFANGSRMRISGGRIGVVASTRTRPDAGRLQRTGSRLLPRCSMPIQLTQPGSQGDPCRHEGQKAARTDSAGCHLPTLLDYHQLSRLTGNTLPIRTPRAAAYRAVPRTDVDT